MKNNTVHVEPGGRLPLEDYLTLMAREVDGLGWDAILVYDRSKTNVILLQEYIQRFNGQSWFPPATFDSATTPGVIERVIDYRFDKPRLSFANADLESSKLDLIMKVVGGKQLTIENPQNEKIRQLTRIKMADALNGPVLRARVNLEEISVGVSDGVVGVDLSKGTAYELSFADTPVEEAIGGESVKRVFEEWLGDKRIFELSHLPQTSNLMNPETIAIRTQASADSNVMGAASEGDGAVLIFVKMEGNTSDLKLPSKTFSYFIPGRQSEFSAVMLFSKLKMFDRIAPVLIENIRREGISFDAAYRDGVITATNGGRLQRPGNKYLDNGYMMDADVIGAVYSDQRADNGHFGEMTLRLVGNDIQLRWTGHGETASSLWKEKRVDSGVLVFDYEYSCGYDLLPNADGIISFKAKDKFYSSRMVAENWSDQARAAQSLSMSGYKATVDFIRIPELSKGFGDLDTQIHLFLLHGLLFRGNQIFQSESLHVPGPLVMLGQLSPALTTFQIDPVETVIGAGRTFTFKTTGEQLPVTWSVANLPDGSGDAGVINSETGVYTAPSRANLPDNQKRVIVTARAKTGGAVSQALVGIVSRDIGLDPIVMMANKGASGYKIRATPLDTTETLTLRMSAGAMGRLIDDPNADPDVPYSKLYVPPASQAGMPAGPQAIPAQWLAYRKTSDWTLEEELAEYLQVEQVIAEGSNGSKQEVEVLLLLQNITNWFVFKPSGQGIQLEHWSTNKKSGDHIVPEDKTYWFKVKGSGTLVDGVYTPDPSSDETYAVIVAIEENDDVYKWVPAIVPVPFVGVETYLGMLQEDLK